MKKKFVSFVAGRSGGHIIPAMTLLQKFLDKNPNFSVLFFSTATEIDESIIKNYNFVGLHKRLKLGNVPGKNPFAWLKFTFQFFVSFLRSFFILLKLKPTCVVSMGGYVSIPVCFSAWILRIPIDLYELNAVPGSAVKFLCRIAKKTNLCFLEAKKYLSKNAQCKKVNYPIRYSKSEKIEKKVAREMLKINPEKKVIFVLGGSHGSRFINNFMKDFLNELPKKKDSYNPSSWKKNFEEVKNFYKKNDFSATLFSYEPELNVYFSATDLVISRAGAGALFEIIFFKKSAMIIPLEISSTLHQLENAYTMEKKYPENFKVLRQKEIRENPKILLSSCFFLKKS